MEWPTVSHRGAFFLYAKMWDGLDNYTYFPVSFFHSFLSGERAFSVTDSFLGSGFGIGAESFIRLFPSAVVSTVWLMTVSPFCMTAQ